MVVTPRQQRARKANVGRKKNEIAHAQRWERIKTQRLYQMSRTRPKEFTPQQKRELKHRMKYGETRAQTYRKLESAFTHGNLAKGQFKKFKHALNLDKNWSDYKAFKKYRKKGLASLTKNEFKKADKFANFDFGWSTTKSYKKLKEKGLAELNKTEFDMLSRLGFNIAEGTWRKRRKIKKAKKKGLVEEKYGSLQLSKQIEDYTKSQIKLLREIGFDISRQQRKTSYRS